MALLKVFQKKTVVQSEIPPLQMEEARCDQVAATHSSSSTTPNVSTSLCVGEDEAIEVTLESPPKRSLTTYIECHDVCKKFKNNPGC